MPDQPTSRNESGGENGLTPIPSRIHCPATTDWVGGRDELDEIAVDHFLDTLAEVALAIASRKLGKDQRGGEVDR
ncbi:MAG TPA: hypothetical protein VFA32_24020 [Dehalococcoidia bacterium]|jgi:hypothetical protein|nr:hypothetical protein [Dehalococcoidia bacterium]